MIVIDTALGTFRSRPDGPWERRAFTHQQQPTKYSCGPTVVAMIVGRPVRDLLVDLVTVRRGKRRDRMARSHRTNIGELRRLAERHGYTLGTRRQGWPPDNVTAVIRLAKKFGKHGWHWMLWDAGAVHDPLSLDAELWPKIRWEAPRVSYYEVTRG